MACELALVDERVPHPELEDLADDVTGQTVLHGLATADAHERDEPKVRVGCWALEEPASDDVKALGANERQKLSSVLLFVPRGMAHTVWNSGDRPVRGLILVSPGGAEHVFVPVQAG